MAYITQKQIKGNTYYYAEESEWKDGKPHRKWQKYLGSLKKIMTAMTGEREKPLHAEIFQLGAPAAYWHMAEHCRMIPILDDILPKRQQGLSIGTYLTLAAMNRAIQPVSKHSMWHWFQDTILLRLFPKINKETLSSQRFWDNLSSLDSERIEQAWLKLIRSVLTREQIDLSCVSFDGTNFYSFIGSFNTRCSLAKRGKNKQGRTNLRQVNYALFCTRKDHIPLYFDVFEGNRHDSKEFGLVMEKFARAFADFRPAREGITIVFDKGNNSKSNLNAFADWSGYHFVGSVKVDDHKDLALISNQDARLAPLEDPRLDPVKAFRCRKSIYGKDMTVVVTFNNNLYTAQVQSLHNELNKCLDRLHELSLKLEDRRSGRVTKGKAPTAASVKNQVSTILKGQYMKRLMETTVTVPDGIPRLSYWVNSKVQAELNDTYLGKNILITDNHDWSTEEIILTYRSQYGIEDLFKQMKDRNIGTWWPMFHWTDPMIRAHALYCSLALLLRSLVMRKVRHANLSISMNLLHEKLFGIREIINVFKKSQNGKPTQSVISKQDEIQKRLFDLFEMKRFLDS